MRIPFLSKRYDDDQLDQCVMTSLESDGLVDTTRLAINSKDGIVTIQGRARNTFEKKRVGSIAQQGLEASGLRFRQIVDNVSIE
ncbi:MAG: BON domain-containing protein [Caldilineaceae bacterium]